MSKRSSAADDDASPSTVRLLLHTVDGAVPLSTPHLLRKYVPPSEFLWLGVAVRDSGVVPVYPSVHPTATNLNKTKKKKKKPASPIDPTKPCGYTFTNKPLDGVLEDYRRVLVPSFDLCQDMLERGEQGPVTSTQQQIAVWTPHGRNPLTVPIYNGIVQRQPEKKASAVALYDMALDAHGKNRRETAARRTELWLQALFDSKPSCEVWAPLVLTGALLGNDKAVEVVEKLLECENLGGVAIVGWPHVPHEQRARLQNVMERIKIFNRPDFTVAVLATKTTRQFLYAIRAGVSVVGSSLPLQWSKSKRAFVCKLEKNSDTPKRAKVEGVENLPLDSDGCIDLTDSRWERDTRPLVPGCACVACNDKLSRAYIYHLVKAKELLAEILLFGHNLYHLVQLCKLSSTTAARRDEICSFVESQLLEVKNDQ